MVQECCVVLVTSPQAEATRIARELVDQRVAACVNIVSSVRSVYLWQGRVCDEAESLLVIKTTAAQFEQLRQRVIEAHPYDVPEVIALPITAGHLPYLEWIEHSTAASSG
jgi:periplasmic divalent cation tolerance protein